MDSRQIVAIVEAIFFKGCSLFEARAISIASAVRVRRKKAKLPTQ